MQDELSDGVGLGPEAYLIFMVYGYSLFFADSGQLQLPLFDVLNEDSCGPEPGKP